MTVLTRRHVISGAGALALAGVAETHAQGTPTATANDTARFLAGLPPSAGSPLNKWTGEESWKGHASSFNASWSRFERAQLAPIRKWSAEHFENPRPTLYYMFSGPDFLYADAFFPGAHTYILAGLEPVGPLPQVTEGNRRSLGRLRSSLSSILNFSFFRTIDMRSDFAGGSFSGTLPILYIFLARAGRTIESVTLITIDASGEAVPTVGAPVRGQISGVQIDFSGADGERRTLYYFSADISNSSPQLQSMLAFCRKHGTGDAFVKSASYLMHSDGFSQIREHLLSTSHMLLQDDSGIPVRHFQQSDWQLFPFGRYLGPIPLFAGRGQSQLGELFRKSETPALEFGVGYRHQKSESNLMLALKKPK